jgi:hypothetical protein
MFGDGAIATNVTALLSTDITAPDYFPRGAIKTLFTTIILGAARSHYHSIT